MQQGSSLLDEILFLYATKLFGEDPLQCMCDTGGSLNLHMVLYKKYDGGKSRRGSRISTCLTLSGDDQRDDQFRERIRLLSNPNSQSVPYPSAKFV